MDAADYDPARFRVELEAKDASHECPCCGATDWEFLGDGVFAIEGNASEEGAQHRLPARMECAPIVCRNCVFVRLHVLGFYL